MEVTVTPLGEDHRQILLGEREKIFMSTKFNVFPLTRIILFIHTHTKLHVITVVKIISNHFYFIIIFNSTAIFML